MTSTTSINFIQVLENSFSGNQNLEIATKQVAYMRHQFSFLGIQKPIRAKLQLPVFKTFAQAEKDAIIAILLTLWEKKEREYQYAALDLAQFHQKKWEISDIEIFETLIRSKSWWDSVDCLAANVVGKLIFNYNELSHLMDLWIQDENLWIRRTALIYQLSWKNATDEKRLFRYCKAVMIEKNFFIQKAIGWALRQYSKIQPTAVRRFVDIHRKHLSPLSYREAVKHI